MISGMIFSIGLSGALYSVQEDFGSYYQPDYWVTKFCNQAITRRDYRPLRATEAFDACYDYIFIDQARVDFVLFAMCRAEKPKEWKEAQAFVDRLFPDPNSRQKLTGSSSCVPKQKDGTRILELSKATINALKNSPWSGWPLRKRYRQKSDN